MKEAIKKRLKKKYKKAKVREKQAPPDNLKGWKIWNVWLDTTKITN